MDPYRIDTLKVLKASGIGHHNPQQQAPASQRDLQSQITDLVTLPNGAIITCSLDKTLSLWEEKKGNNSCAACCSIF